ncbi:MAG: hypothetical protein DRN17_05465 [Thermoplasmata archaeon]|nr:MAG: hypothetical protein DRN17_05465 [Thermoplasmata archaeon]
MYHIAQYRVFGQLKSKTKIFLGLSVYPSMNYLLIFMTALVAFTWGMLFAFYLIFVRTATRLSRLLSRFTGDDVSMEEVYQTFKNIIDKAYEDLKNGKNEDSDEVS